jgi:ABC-type transport system involved in cytochrome c biogenesis permease component
MCDLSRQELQRLLSARKLTTRTRKLSVSVIPSPVSLPRLPFTVQVLAATAHHFRARSQIELAAAKTIVQNASVGCMSLSSYRGVQRREP